MSLFNTLNTGASGLGVNSDSLSVIGDNIANMNTTGFKSSRASFADYMPQDVSGLAGPTTIGSGAALNTVATLFGQGSLSGTSSATDLAISGSGFFVVEDGDASYYTRAGEFYLDEDGYIVTADGMNLQGYGAEDGTLSSLIGDLQIGTEPVSASATSEVSISAALSTNAEWDEDGDGTADTYLTTGNLDGNGYTWDELDDYADATTSLTVYDSLGEAHEVTIAFERTGESDWSFYVVMDGADATGGTEDYPFCLAEGTMSFDSDGQMTSFTQTNVDSWDATWSLANGASQLSMDFLFGLDDAGDETDGNITMTGDEDSSFSAISQDGYPQGELTNLAIESDGTITGTYTNGEELTLGQVVLANFTSESGLDRLGNTLFSATASSGDPAVGAAGSGGRGSIVSYALESSNVELEDEFVTMITAQRGYQASARVITTADETLQELVNLV